jgi:replicative DNA helicase
MLTRCRQPLKLKAWALAIAKRSTMRKARIALARRLTEISSGLKGLTKEVGIPVLGLSQLNREVEKRQDKRPQLADLRESGSIEQDADVVLGLYREAYYLEHKADRSEAETDRLARCQNLLEVEILKQRSGPTIRIECFADIACNVLAEAVP